MNAKAALFLIPGLKTIKEPLLDKPFGNKRYNILWPLESDNLFNGQYNNLADIIYRT